MVRGSEFGNLFGIVVRSAHRKRITWWAGNSNRINEMFSLYNVRFRHCPLSHYTSMKQAIETAEALGLLWWQYEIMHDGKLYIPGVNLCTCTAKLATY